MNMFAILTMIVTMTIVTSFAVYFFIKMMRTPPKTDTSTQPNSQRKE